MLSGSNLLSNREPNDQAKAFSVLSAGKSYSHNPGFTSERNNGSLGTKTGTQAIPLDLEILQKVSLLLHYELAG